jgi:ribosome-dependent ATPase
MRSGELALAIEIPPGFGRDVLRGSKVPWAPGSTAPCPSARDRQRLCPGHAPALAGQRARERLGVQLASQVSLETRFRYNPDVKSLPAMVPAVIPLLLMMLPPCSRRWPWCAKRSWAPS